MIVRETLRKRVDEALSRSPVVALLGARQVGKTTLARGLVGPRSPNYFDLEDPLSLARLSEPMTALSGLKGLVVIDEVQRLGDLFPVLRVLADRPRTPARFLVLGSAAPAFLRQSSESLAGRIEVIEVSGFSLPETGIDAAPRRWLRGGFPRSYLARTEADSRAWRRQFLLALAERDLPQMGMRVPPGAAMRFLSMLAHYHGQVWNAAEPARSLGISETSVRRYLDLLSGAYFVRQLQPWHENIGKRQVKAPKIYWRDSGLFHQLVGIESRHTLLAHPKCGASWEGLVMEELIGAVAPDEVYFWATHTGAELDGLFIKHGRRIGVEIKRADAPRLTPSMRSALQDLGLDRLVVVYPGKQAYPLHEKVEVLPLELAITRALAER
ncbi:hypothetical protein BURK2_01398 [Burkholderiales bacterium]|nr:hypothetical protein BURK2_01398 [Burkholderiales bacterium]